ncbi:MAG: metalloregulator ArsR/SmtB family transcription factor [Cytophagales bacterium]|nr:metalloregulator ArsR/SmtB family transcription factor [Cytophagales bacterium]
MGITKSLSFSNVLNHRAKYYKALGHPARLAIIDLLIQKHSCICNDLVDELPLSQSTVSQHLRELKDAGIIKGDIEGQKVCYCINTEVWQQIQEDINVLFSSYNNTNNCC